jgi:hypothetical protein
MEWPSWPGTSGGEIARRGGGETAAAAGGPAVASP